MQEVNHCSLSSFLQSRWLCVSTLTDSWSHRRLILWEMVSQTQPHAQTLLPLYFWCDANFGVILILVWYQFCDTNMWCQLWCVGYLKPLYLTETLYHFGDNDRDSWAELFSLYRLPPYDLPRLQPVLSFGLAGPGTGVPFHIHGPTFAETIYGRKVRTPASKPYVKDVDTQVVSYLYQYSIEVNYSHFSLITCSCRQQQVVKTRCWVPYCANLVSFSVT